MQHRTLDEIDDVDAPLARGEPLAGLNEYVAIDALIKLLEQMKKRALAALRPTLTERLLVRARQQQDRPKGFLVVDTLARATVSLRRRAASRPLEQAEIEALAEARVPLAAPARGIAINPRYADDPTALAALARLVAQNPGVLPPDFLRPAKVAVVVDDDLLLRVLRLPQPGRLVEIVADISLARAEIDVDEQQLAGLARAAVARLAPPPEPPPPREERPRPGRGPRREPVRDVPALASGGTTRRYRPRPIPS